MKTFFDIPAARLLAVVCSVASLWWTGCAVYHPKPIAAEENAAAFDDRALDDPRIKDFLETMLQQPPMDWPPKSWNFTMLTLAALYYHPDLELARARWATAEAARITAGESPNPSVSVLPAFDTTRAAPSPWVVTASLDVPIETAGKRGYRLAQAGHLSDAARASIGLVAWQVRSRLRRTMIALYAAVETEALLRHQQSVQAEIVEILEAQLREGAVSAFDVTQARIILDNNQLALRDAERQSAEARAQLASALGVRAHALDAVTISFDEFVEPPPSPPSVELRRSALLDRSDVLASLADYAASEAALQLEIAKQYPDVHLNPGYEFDQGENKWALGLSITLPVLNQNQGPIAEADGRRRQAAAQFTALQAAVAGEIDRTTAAYAGTLAKTATADMLVANSARQERTVKAMLDAGEASKLVLLTAQLELDHNALGRLAALVQAQDALGQLEDAVESPLGASEVRLPVQLGMAPDHE